MLAKNEALLRGEQTKLAGTQAAIAEIEAVLADLGQEADEAKGG